MKTTQFTQGTPQWLAHRMACWNASDAPVMMGCSPYKSRSQLLKELHTGITPDVDTATQRRFDEGHRIEALARDLAQEIIGEELYPVSGVHEDLTIGGRPVAASFDGLTMFEEVGFEHKTLNDELRSIQHFVGQELPLQYRVQMEQQMLVSGAQKVLFMASKWDGDTLVEERHCWYMSDGALRDQIIAGWKQFAADLAAYVPTESAPAVVAAPVEALPAVSVRMDGALAIQSNLPTFAEALRAFIAKLPEKPSTDQEFADTEAACKALKKAEDALDAAEAGALASMSDVEAMRRMVADCKSLARTTRLAHEKLVAARKDAIRTELVMQAQADLARHIRELNAAMPGDYLPANQVPADFGGVIKGKKTVDSIRDALGTELARAKIAAGELANRIHGNVKAIKESGLVVHDTAALVLKAPEDLANVLAVRRADQERRENEARERIRAEEQAKADREARARLEQEQREEAAKKAAEEAAEQAKAAQPQITPVRELQQVLKAEAATPDATDRSIPATASPGVGPMGAGQPADAGPVGNVVPLPTRVPAVDTSARIKLGEVNALIAPLSITADGLAALGFPLVETDKGAKLYRLADVPAILAAMVRHLEAVQAKAAA